MDKKVVTISRLWNNPHITTTINIEGIELEISLEDYLTALIKEIGSITFVVSNDKFSNKVRVASNKVLEGMKLESSKVVIK